MKTIRVQKRITITAIILSLLFHGSIILYILLQRSAEKTPLSLQEQDEALQKKIKQEEQWAETKARSGNFGTPTFFKDPAYAKALADKEPEISDTSQDNETKEKTTTQKEEPKSVVEKAEKSSTQAKQHEEVTIQRQRRTRPLIEKPQNPAPPQRAITQPKKPIPPSVPAPKKLPTLAQLTEGFLHSRDEGTHAVAMLGNKSGRPTDEQIKYERYLQKLSYCLQNSFSINNDRYPIKHPIDVNVHIFLSLNKDGTVKQISLAKSSKIIALDQFAIFLMQDASGSFPPVPQYLPHDPFSITYVINFNTTNQNNIGIYRR